MFLSNYQQRFGNSEIRTAFWKEVINLALSQSQPKPLVTIVFYFWPGGGSKNLFIYIKKTKKHVL